jgi:hypothetical protein
MTLKKSEKPINGTLSEKKPLDITTVWDMTPFSLIEV